ncbi:MAG: hypothetical protein SynsKO_25420 [Synoicihabitans sp.]
MKKLLSALLAMSLSAAASSADDLKFSDPLISIGVVVSDLDASVKFYTESIGMKKTGGFKVPGEFATKLGLTHGKTLDVTVLKLEDSPDAPQWKLMSFGDAAKAQRSKHIDGFTGMQYITINVEDLAPFIMRLKKHGVKMLGEAPVELPSGKHFVLVQDPDGTFIELIGPMK